VRNEPILAIIGASASASEDQGIYSSAGLMAEAVVAAVAQSGVKRSQIDGLLSASAYYYMPTPTLAEYLGIRPSYTDSTTIGGCSNIAHLRHAAFAIDSGACDVAVIAHASTQRSDGKRRVKSMSEPLAYELPYGPLWPIAGYAMIARRHMHEFGTTSEQLAEVAVAARKWALLNPGARWTEPITAADVLASPMIAEPLHRLDCCMVTDGAGALVVTSPERARDLCENPVYVLGGAETHVARNVSQLPDFVTAPATITAPKALRQAGVELSDIDNFQVYDAFTITTLQILEGLGLCPIGEGGAFVEDGRTRPGGSTPVNTSGGGLSYRHPGMLGMTLLLEAVAQLRREAGDRQVEDSMLSLVHGLGGVQMSGATAILAGPGWVG
jgi:acetyl-CoA acetyltransferase